MTRPPPKAEAVSSSDQVSTLTETAYRSIKRELLSGHVEAGTKLRIDPLRARLGIGASPIREALSRLVSEGFVTIEEQKGFRAAPMSVDEFRDITELRILLETTAVRRAIERGGEDWESNILATHHRLAKAEERLAAGQSVDFETRNRDFHDALVSACGSDWLMRVRATLYAHSQRYRLQSLVAGKHRRRNTAKEHRQMREAVLARDADKAATLIAQHFQLTLDIFETARRGAKPLTSPSRERPVQPSRAR